MTVSNVSELVAREKHQQVGLILGPALFAIMMAVNQSFMPEQAWTVSAILVWMAVWWSTEAVPVPATAFIPIVTFDLLDIATTAEATAPYAHPIIFLFLGAFVLALAVEKWDLHKRIALMILSKTGTDGKQLILGFMIVAALLSMWMTNTSTTMMLLPIALSVATVITQQTPGIPDQAKNSFQTAMLLGVAFAATIGGLSTLIGTPPNAWLAAFLSDQYGIEISFARWMLVGVPVAIILLPIAWLVLTRVAFKVAIPKSAEAQQYLESSRTALGSITSAEKRVAIVFLIVVFGWILRRPIANLTGFSSLNDSAIAMFGALLLFLIPASSSRSEPLMRWADMSRLPWGVLILFGGGLSLAAAVSSSGLAAWLGESLAGIDMFGTVFIIVIATCLVIFLTELTSNLATAATFLPAIGAIALQLNIDPIMLTVPVTLAASCAFMLPVATPPNAIVFSSGMITIPQMIRAGVLLNLVSIVLLSIVAAWWAPYVFS